MNTHLTQLSLGDTNRSPILAAYSVMNGEARSIYSAVVSGETEVEVGVPFVSGLVGFFLSYTSVWFMSTTTPAIFSLVVRSICSVAHNSLAERRHHLTSTTAAYDSPAG